MVVFFGTVLQLNGTLILAPTLHSRQPLGHEVPGAVNPRLNKLP